jgi:hypothetical protein
MNMEPFSPRKGKTGESGSASLQPPEGSQKDPGGGPEFPGYSAEIRQAVGDHCSTLISQVHPLEAAYCHPFSGSMS